MAIVLSFRGKVGLFKRSQAVGHDGGLWHCLTGYIEPGVSVHQQAIQEIFEETGLLASELDDLIVGSTLTLRDHTGADWTVHTFLAKTARRRLTLNWEHDSYRWTSLSRVSRFGHVHWLPDVIDATTATSSRR